MEMDTRSHAPLRHCGVLLVLVALAAAGCSTSSPGPTGAPPPGSPTSAAPGAPDQATICGAAVDVSTALSDGPDIGDEPVTPQQVDAAFNEYRARLEPPLIVLEQNPPPGLKENIDTLARQARFAIQNKDVAAVSTDDFQAAVDRLQSYVVRSCGYPVVRVNAADYAFSGIPPTLAAGTTVFTLTDGGTEPHELDVYRLDDDTPQPMAELVKLPEAQRNEVLQGVASISVNPGSSEMVFTTLTPGRYGVACFEPKGSTPEKEGTGPPHATLGMVGEFTVS
jgi:uncharacterized cupredoxin-like copper-binding protein